MTKRRRASVSFMRSASATERTPARIAITMMPGVVRIRRSPRRATASRRNTAFLITRDCVSACTGECQGRCLTATERLDQRREQLEPRGFLQRLFRNPSRLDGECDRAGLIRIGDLRYYLIYDHKPHSVELRENSERFDVHQIDQHIRVSDDDCERVHVPGQLLTEATREWVDRQVPLRIGRGPIVPGASPESARTIPPASTC